MYNQDLDIFKLEIDETAKATMLEMSRWTKFLAIAGFIFIGLMILAGVGLGTYYSSLYADANTGINGIVIFIYIIVLAGLYFYPILALLKYSTHIKTALKTADKNKFNQAVRYLKNMFKYIGILMIVLIALYGLIIVVYIIGVAGKL